MARMGCPGKEGWTGQSGSSLLGHVCTWCSLGEELLVTAPLGWVSCLIVTSTALTAVKASVLTLLVLPVPLPWGFLSFVSTFPLASISLHLLGAGVETEKNLICDFSLQSTIYVLGDGAVTSVWDKAGLSWFGNCRLVFK